MSGVDLTDALNHRLIKINYLFKISLSVLALCCLTLSPPPASGERSAALSIHEYRALSTPAGQYIVEGYVVKTYTCPPCPPQDQCKPCMRNHILLSDNTELLTSYSVTDNYILLYTEDALQFTLKGRYEFTIEAIPSRHEGKILAFKSL
jgi:hypothetical protein